MPLPLIPLAVAGGAALLALRKAPVKSPPAGTSVAPAGGQLAPTSQAPGVPGSLSSAGGIASAAAAAIAAGTGGAALDKALNPNTSIVSQTAAGIAVGGTVGLAVLAAFGILGVTFPIVGIFLAVAVAIYFAIVFIQDLARLQYGQAGARRDFLKQFSDVYSNAKQNIGANPSVQLNPLQLERQLQPFAEGFMARLNWSAYQGIMAKKGVVVSGQFSDARSPSQIVGGQADSSGIPFVLPVDGQAKFPGTDQPVTTDLLWHLNWYVDRGYVVAQTPGARDFDNPLEFEPGPFGIMPWQQSRVSEWVLAHCPSGDLIRADFPDVAPLAPKIIGVQTSGLTPVAPAPAPTTAPAPAPAPTPVSPTVSTSFAGIRTIGFGT